MNTRNRRRGGLTLLCVMALQAATTVSGVCAQPHVEHEGDGHDMAALSVPMEATDHGHPSSHGGDPDVGPMSHSGEMPVDCLTVAACEVPAVRPDLPLPQFLAGGDPAPYAPAIADLPAVVSLSLLTPPPKI